MLLKISPTLKYMYLSTFPPTQLFASELAEEFEKVTQGDKILHFDDLHC
jgi:hypothetical protein